MRLLKRGGPFNTYIQYYGGGGLRGGGSQPKTFVNGKEGGRGGEISEK